MDISEEILYYIKNYFSVDYDIVGHETTVDIITTKLSNKEPDIFTSEHGSNFDIVASLEIIALVVGIVKTTIEIIQHLRKKNEKVVLEKIKKQVLQKIGHQADNVLDEEQLTQLLTGIIARQ